MPTSSNVESFQELSCCFRFLSTRSYDSFIHSGHFYSAPSSPLLLRGAPDYSTDTVSEFHAEAVYDALHTKFLLSLGGRTKLWVLARIERTTRLAKVREVWWQDAAAKISFSSSTVAGMSGSAELRLPVGLGLFTTLQSSLVPAALFMWPSYLLFCFAIRLPILEVKAAATSLRL